MPEQSTHKKWFVLILVLLLFAGGWLLYRSLFPPYTPPRLPVPNGYEDLLSAAKQIAPQTDNYAELDDTQLAAVVKANQPALQLARTALQKECMVALNWSANREWLENVHMENSQSLRTLARAFAAAARHANRTGQTDEAVRSGLDIIDLANATGRGGLIIDRMMAGGVHYTALYSLRAQVGQLTRDDSLKLIQRLKSSPLVLEPPDEVFERESALFRKINGAMQTFMLAGVMRSQNQQAVAEMEKAKKIHDTFSALLQTHLALRAYQLDFQELPRALDELVPQYLEDVPRDRFSDLPLVYARRVRGYLLYSVGPDGVDDKGVPTTDNQTGDLLLEPDE